MAGVAREVCRCRPKDETEKVKHGGDDTEADELGENGPERCTVTIISSCSYSDWYSIPETHK